MAGINSSLTPLLLGRIDAGVGFATSGLAAIASVRKLDQIYNAAQSGKVFAGEAGLYGAAQVTGKGTNVDHAARSIFEAQSLVRSQGGTAYLDTSVSKLGITGTARNYRPDVTHLANAGRVNTVEVASVSQQSGGARNYLTAKTNDIRNAVTSQGASFGGRVIEYGDSSVGLGEVYGTFYSGAVNNSLAGYQSLKVFTSAEPATAAPYSGGFSGAFKLGK